MADPRTENGYIKIANELFEALARTRLSGQESRVLFAIIRKTYGWGKTWDEISYSQISALTEISSQHVHHTIVKLLKRKIIERKSLGKNKGYKMKINKDYEQWIALRGSKPNRLKLPKQAIAKTDIKVLPNQARTIDTTKDNNNIPIQNVTSGTIKDFFEEWNTAMGEVKVRMIRFPDEIDSKNPRYKRTMVRLSEPFFHKNYKEAMRRVAESDFCNGQINSSNGRTPWVADVDWFLRPGKVMEILEDKFDNSRWSVPQKSMRPEDLPV